MNRFTHMLVAGSLLSVTTLASISVNASAATDCVATVAEARGSAAVNCPTEALPAYPPNPGGSTETTTTTTTIGVPVGPNVASSTVATPVGGGSGGGGSSGTTPTTVNGSAATGANVGGVSVSAPTTAVPAAAPAVAPAGEVAASPISFTGAQSTVLAGIAAALTALGACFLVIGRRRQAKAPTS